MFKRGLGVVSIVVAFGLSHPAMSAGTGGTAHCQFRVTGDVNQQITAEAPAGALTPNSTPEEVSKLLRVSASTDYWTSEANRRDAVQAVAKAESSLMSSAQFKNGGMSNDEIKQRAAQSVNQPLSAADRKNADRDLKAGTGLAGWMVLSFMCGDGSAHVNIVPAGSMTHADVPFKPGKYRIKPWDASEARPGDFTVLTAVLMVDGKRDTYVANEPGVLELTKFDTHSLEGKFSFKAKSRFGTPHQVAFEGSFYYPCKGVACR